MKTRFLIAALLAATAPAAAAAQRDSLSLSLAQAQGIAAENNPGFRRVRTEIGTAEADVRRARGAYLPSLSLGISASGGYSRVFTGQDQFGNPVVRDDPLEFRSSSASQSLGVGDITLFDAGARNKELRAARAGQEATEARVSAQELQLRGEVERRYWEAVRTDRQIRLEEELLASAQERLRSVEALVRVGVRGPIDVLGAQVTVADQEAALDRARGDARRAQLDLRQAMGVLDGPPLRLTDAPADLFDPASLDPAALVSRALVANPRMAGVDAVQRQAANRVAAARTLRWPRLSTNATLSRRQGFSGYQGLYEPNPLDQAVSFGFALRMPLFSQYQTSYQIQAARAAEVAAQEDARAERQAVERDVRAGVVDLQNAYTAAMNAARALDLNRRRLDLAQQQYRVGSLTQTDLTDAVERAALAERQALVTRFAFAVALATLRERVGAPVAP